MDIQTLEKAYIIHDQLKSSQEYLSKIIEKDVYKISIYKKGRIHLRIKSWEGERFSFNMDKANFQSFLEMVLNIITKDVKEQQNELNKLLNENN